MIKMSMSILQWSNYGSIENIYIGNGGVYIFLLYMIWPFDYVARGVGRQLHLVMNNLCVHMNKYISYLFFSWIITKMSSLNC